MHEMGPTEEILKSALNHAKEADAPRVTDVYIVLGRLSSISDDSVRFYWDMLSKGTPAEGARLHFRDLAPEMSCVECGTRYSTNTDETACPQCGGASVQVVGGQEFYLEAIDVE